MLLHGQVLHVQPALAGQVEDGGRERRGCDPPPLPHEDLDERGRQVRRRLPPVFGQALDPIVLADARPGLGVEEEEDQGPDDLPDAPGPEELHQQPPALFPLLGPALVLGPGRLHPLDRLPDEAGLLLLDRSQARARRRDTRDEPGGPDDADLDELVRGDVDRGEAGRPRVHDLGPAAEGAVPPDVEVRGPRQRLREPDLDRDLPRRTIPAVADDLPIELGHLGIAEDAAADAILDVEGPALIPGRKMPFGLEDAAARARLALEQDSPLVADGESGQGGGIGPALAADDERDP